MSFYKYFKIKNTVTLFLLFSTITISGQTEQESIESLISRVVDYQIHQPMVPKREDRAFPNGWIPSTFYTALMDVYKVTGTKKYFEFAHEWAASNNYKLGPRPLHADDHCAGQVYLMLYDFTNDSTNLKDVFDTFDKMMNERSAGREIWDWCDALFMSPPVFAGLYKITNNAKYLKALNRYYWDAADYLFDREENLFYRDNRFFFKRSEIGNKIFWSRGNGWVFAGLVKIIDALPDENKHKEDYIELFKTLAKRLVSLQREDGVWSPNLLEPELYNMPETSGTGFFSYGLAWGINNGILDKSIYKVHAEKSWNALVKLVDDDGKLQYVQSVGHEPEHVSKANNSAFGAAALLMAASEFLKLESTDEK
ncbi:MAG: glycoside hydrolase family 88 protein [Melioribacteraceae bacterium]|nr:glycoside hydrolase family 88 protein [Melioribacteraceae bacterium]MCF8262900.1 glycoside hydrolase family 88 protein [Melioribacteraceae bacterium]MCF8430922.1 glycoside hydrolase family 88 protein [Melioribacteraceae bacterium]